MGDIGGEPDSEQDIEDLARRLFALETKGVDAWGLELLSSAKRSNFRRSWDEADESARRAYRQRARQVVAARRKDGGAAK